MTVTATRIETATRRQSSHDNDVAAKPLAGSHQGAAPVAMRQPRMTDDVNTEA